MEGIVRAWGKILAGYQPNVSIEITRECPLTCPGCYAYGDNHLGGTLTLRELNDRKGQDLVDGVLSIVRRYKPLHVSLVGGEPLVRYRELDTLLPRLAQWVFTRSSSRAPCVPSLSRGLRCGDCRSSSRLTASSRSTTNGASPRPTNAF